MISKDAYKRYVEKNAPRSPMWRSMMAAFLVGGLICCLSQGVHDGIAAIFPAMS